MIHTVVTPEHVSWNCVIHTFALRTNIHVHFVKDLQRTQFLSRLKTSCLWCLGRLGSYAVRKYTVAKCEVRGGADKSLARPGRKQATATKLGIIQHTPHEAQYTS